MYKITTRIFIVTLFVALIAGCASTHSSGAYDQHYDFSKARTVAVVSVSGAIGQGARNQIANMFNQQLLSMGYSPIERTQIREVMQEQKFSHSDVTSTSGAAKLGEVLNVPAVIMINIPKYGDTMEMGAKMVDVNTGRILWSANGTAKTGAGMNQLVGGLVGAAAGAGAGYGASGHSNGTLIGGAVGGVAGAVAGKAMTPERQDQAGKLIKKITETLPKG